MFLARTTIGEEHVAGMKKVVLVASVALVLFFLITRPTQSADVVQTSLGGLRNGADGLVTFVHNLFGSGYSGSDHYSGNDHYSGSENAGGGEVYTIH